MNDYNEGYDKGFDHGMRTAAIILLALILIIRFLQ